MTPTTEPGVIIPLATPEYTGPMGFGAPPGDFVYWVQYVVRGNAAAGMRAMAKRTGTLRKVSAEEMVGIRVRWMRQRHEEQRNALRRLLGLRPLRQLHDPT